MIYFELLATQQGQQHVAISLSSVLFSVTLTTLTIIQIKVKALGNNNIKTVFK